MPQLISANAISDAVESALEKQGVLPVKQAFNSALECAGITVETLASQLANLIYTAKDPIKLKAVMAALSAYGINLEKETNLASAPSFTFNLIGDNVQLNSLFAPPRNYEQTLEKVKEIS